MSCGRQTKPRQTPERDVGEVGLPVTLGTRAAGQSSLPKTAGGTGHGPVPADLRRKAIRLSSQSDWKRGVWDGA